MTLLGLSLCALAGWRIAHLLVAEQGPFDVFTKLRDLVGVRYILVDTKMTLVLRHQLSYLFTCVWCMSIWTAALCTALYLFVPSIITTFVLCTLAVSTLQIFVQEMLDDRAVN